MPSPLGPGKTAAIGAITEVVKKNEDCGLRATHILSARRFALSKWNFFPGGDGSAEALVLR
jgi:hypothetical protein